MSPPKRIDSIDEVHQHLHDMGEVTYSYEISESITRDHGDMFEVYLCHKRRNELTSALLVLKENGKIIPTGTDVDAGFYIDEVRAGRWGNDTPAIDEAELLELEKNAEPGQLDVGVVWDDFEIVDD